MNLNTSIIEDLADWCLRSETLSDIRTTARRDYFGYDEPGEVNYMKGAGDLTSRERRFLGWFILAFKLPDGRRPAEVAAANIFSGIDLAYVVDSIIGTRYVLAMVAMVNPGRDIILKLEDEEFTVDSRQLSRFLNRNDALCTHLIPAGRRGWLVGPGWLQWPIHIMPGMQAMLKSFQISPLELERFLQQRSKPSIEERPNEEYPRDSSLKAAVDRMTTEAKAEDHQGLIMTPAQWQKLVFRYMKANHINAYTQEIVTRTGKMNSVEEVNKWLGLAMNIWNNTPQPDRGGKSPFEISGQ